MKLNLYDWFSHYDTEKNGVPKFHIQEMNQNAVRENVFKKLNLPEPVSHTRHTRFHLTRLTAAATAAVVLIAGGTLVTTAAGFGGFRQLSDIIFGKDTEYPDMMEEYYTVPNAEIKNTCENIEARVVGMVGDSTTLYVSMEFTAVGGLTFSEETCTVSDLNSQCWIQEEGCDDMISPPAFTETSYIDETHISKTFLFQDEEYRRLCVNRAIDDLQKANLIFKFRSGYFLSQNPYPGNEYTETTLKRWLGYSSAEMNKSDALTAEDWQKVRDNFVTNDDIYYYPKELLMDSGQIEVTFPIQYSETKTEKLNYTLEKTDITFQLSALTASLTWSQDDEIPSVFGEEIPSCYGEGEKRKTGTFLGMGFCGDGYALLEDGTKIKGASNGTLNLLKYSNYASRDTCPDSVDDDEYQAIVDNNQYDSYLKITFTRPVDPSQIIALYYKDQCIWQRN